MKKSLLGVAAIAILAAAGCTVTGSPPSPRLTFSNYQAVSLNVMSSSVDESYINPSDPENIASQFVVAPSEAIKRYAANRFPASGTGDGTFTIVIEDARMHMKQIDQRNRVLEWSGVGKEDEYRLFLQLRVVPVPSGVSGRPGATTIKIERTLIMPSDVTLADREMRQIKFLEKMVADVDAKIMTALDDIPAIRQ